MGEDLRDAGAARASPFDTWLSETLAARELDTSGYFALSALWLVGPPHRMTAGELVQRVVQTSGGATKSARKWVEARRVARVPFPLLLAAT